MPYTPLTHEECLFRVCAVCTNLRGIKVSRPVSEKEEKKIQVVNPLYKRGSKYFPQGLCSTCHVFLLSRKEKDDDMPDLARGGDEVCQDQPIEQEQEKETKPLPNIEPIFPENYHCFLPHETRNSPQGPCTCRWCKIGRLNGNKFKSWALAAKKSREGQPAIHTICSKCGRGLQLGQKTHKCSSSDLSTVNTMLQHIPSSIKPKLASSLLKELADGGDHAVQLPPASGGLPMSVQLGKQKAPAKLSELTHKEMLTMSSKHHLTGTQSSGLWADLRGKWGNKVLDLITIIDESTSRTQSLYFLGGRTWNAESLAEA